MQLVVPALLDDPTAVEHEDAVGSAHAREAVRDEHHGVPLGQPADLLEDLVLAARVERGGRLVEDQHRCVTEVGPGQRHPLPLSERQVASTPTNESGRAASRSRRGVSAGTHPRPPGQLLA
jgi:hypothetical protein